MAGAGRGGGGAQGSVWHCVIMRHPRNSEKPEQVIIITGGSRGEERRGAWQYTRGWRLWGQGDARLGHVMNVGMGPERDTGK